MLPATIEPDALRALEVSASPPSWGAGLAALLAVAVLAWAVRGADWARVADGSDDAPDAPGAGAHRFWGLATAVAVLWHADPAGVAGLHLLGAATACALLGLRPALVALAIGIAFRHVADGLAPQALPAAFLAGAALPAAIAHAGLRWALAGRERLGPVPWVAGAFATGAASMLASVAARAWLAGGAVPAAPDAATGVALLLAMALAEAQLSAGVVAVVAAQRPAWLAVPGLGAPRRAPPRPRR